MIDLQKLLKICLTEQEANVPAPGNQPTANTPANQNQNAENTDLSIDNLFGNLYFKKVSNIETRLATFKTLFGNQYGATLDDKDIQSIARACKGPWTSKSAQPFLEKGDLFPVIDLIFFIAERIA